jgi:hypothetical protein
MSTQPQWTSAESIHAVRPQVRQLLTDIPAFHQLPPEEQRTLAANMVKVMSYISNPNGVVDDLSPEGKAVQPAAPLPLAAAQNKAVEATKQNLSASPGMVGKDFRAGAVREGVNQFGAMVKKVDFPKFVGGLIKNVFQSIVESSIEQMQAYGELIANVSKTVDSFMQDNISTGAGRDWLAEKYPDALGVEANNSAMSFAEGAPAPAPTATLVARGDNAETRLNEISRELNLAPPVTDISDADAELRLVTAARLQMAKSRQQLLASMVMLGINRIVVTDGSIVAKVVFDMRADDKARRDYSASMHDEESQRTKKTLSASYGGWFSPVKVKAGYEDEQSHMATVGSSLDETSESKAEVKAKLSGEVRVNFKSDFLPMEKMATPEMMSIIQGNSTPYNPNTPQRAAGAA